MISKYINANKIVLLIEEMIEKSKTHYNSEVLGDLLDKVISFQKVEAQPVVHGHWIADARYKEQKCSHCGEFGDGKNYCSHCGARMDGES